MKSLPRTALVACSPLVDFAGAEMATLKISQRLRSLGIKVKLAVLEIGVPFDAEL